MAKGHKDKIAVITGASGGIGQAFAKRLAEDGVHIAIADIAPGDQTVKLVEQAGRHVQQRGLAAAGGADDGDELVGGDRQVGGSDGRVALALGHGELHGHAVEADGRLKARRGLPCGRAVWQWTLSLSALLARSDADLVGPL